MSTTQKKPRGARKKQLRSLLPESALAVVWEGKKFVAVPDKDVDSWLEDLIDGIEATLSLRDAGPRLSQAEVKKRYGIRSPVSWEGYRVLPYSGVHRGELLRIP